MPWPAGTDAAVELKKRLAAFLGARLKDPEGPYKARLPRQHLHVEDGGKRGKGTAGVRVWLYTGADEQLPRPCQGPPRHLMEFHRVTLDVEADDKSGGAASVEAVFGALKALLSTQAEWEALIAQGIHNLRESPQALQIEGVEFKRPLTITCTTDTAL